jgi:hypothetical protein
MNFAFTPTASGTDLCLLAGTTPVPLDRWPIEASANLLPGVECLTALVATEQALADDTSILVSDDAIAALSSHEAAALGLPPLTDAIARVTTRGIVSAPTFRAELTWCRSTGQAFVDARRLGAWLEIGGQHRRLSPALLAIGQAVEAVAAAPDIAARLLAVGRLREALPAATLAGSASVSGLPAQVDIMQADAFSLDLKGVGAAARLVPILHRAGSGEALLSPEQQDEFGHRQFNAFADARPVYSLAGNTFVVLTPTLRRALSEVRRHQASPATTKRDLMSAPRRFLRAALDADDDPTLLDRVETVFVETRHYSDRVIGLGLWEPRDVPWLVRTATKWLDHDAPRSGAERCVDDLSPTQADALRSEVAAAIAANEPVVVFRAVDDPPDVVPLLVRATPEMLDDLCRRASGEGSQQPSKPERPPVEVPLIHTNEAALGHQRDFAQRPALPLGLPACLETPLKDHQAAGLKWLQQNWRAGAPGVLLADDMGLGKTLQGLAFLA